MAAQHLVKFKCYFSWQAQHLVKFKCYFVAGAALGEVAVPLFAACEVFGEIWNDSRSAKCCIFQCKMLVVGVKSNLGCEAGCGRTVSFSDRPCIVNDVSSVFSKFL